MRHRYALMWMCLAVACSTPAERSESEPTHVSPPDTRALMRSTLALTSQPGSSPVETQHAKDRLLARTDAMATLMGEFNRLPADNIGRWHLIRLITAGAERADQSAIGFLLREALVPDPPRASNREDANAMGVVPEEVMTKLQAAMGLVASLVAGAGGSADALYQLLQQGDPWLAKTVAMQMAHDRVMDQQYSSIMAGRGLVHRFRDATFGETQARTTIVPANPQFDAPLPPRRP